MTTLDLLDTFCGAGGCSAGYVRAGFRVTGVDRQVQHRYPFPDLHQGDALAVLDDVEYCRQFAAIHASPPCQPFCAMKHLAGPKPRLIAVVREKLERIGRPYVIENVSGAAAEMPGAVQVCGTALGLRVQRHRLFLSNVPIVGTGCDHSRPAMNPHNQAGRDAIYAEFGPGDPEPHWRRAMGVEWMGRKEAREAVPPAMTEFVGQQLAAWIRSGELLTAAA